MDMIFLALLFCFCPVSIVVRVKKYEQLYTAVFNFEGFLVVIFTCYSILKLFSGSFWFPFLVLIWVFPIIYSWPQSELEKNKRQKYQRITHCYRCKSYLNSMINTSCLKCGWIICSNCKACGCFYRQYF